MTRRKMYVPIMNRNEKKILIKLFKNGYIVENEPFAVTMIPTLIRHFSSPL